MKLFIWEEFDPQGGWKDFVVEKESIDECLEYVEKVFRTGLADTYLFHVVMRNKIFYVGKLYLEEKVWKIEGYQIRNDDVQI
jgi:hypothetical protein